MLLWLGLIACVNNAERTSEIDPLPPKEEVVTPQGAAGPAIMTKKAAWSWDTPASNNHASPSEPMVVGDCGGLLRKESPPNRRRPKRKPSASAGVPRPSPAPSFGLGSEGKGSAGGGMAPSAAPAESKPMERRALDALGYAAPSPPPSAKADAAAKPLADAKQEPSLKQEKKRHTRDESEDNAARGQLVADEELEPTPTPSSALEWGAEVHLSNDDSMSLASAQRVIWSAQQGKRPKLSEVRPHELLNYFSFDTAEVPAGGTFSVLGSAEQTGDTMTMALAVQGGIPDRQPLDLTLVVDRSGSMRAEGRMEYTKSALHKVRARLLPGDRVDLVTFSSGSCKAITGYVEGRDDANTLKAAIDSIRPSGGTNLEAGLKDAYSDHLERSDKSRHGRNQRVMLFTDAMLNAGNVNEAVLSEVGKGFNDHGIRLTGVGVGREFNDKFLDMLTEKGKGAYVYLSSQAVVDHLFSRTEGFDSLVRTIAHDVRFSLDLPPSLAMEKFYGEEASTNEADIQPVNYYAGTSQVFLQDLKIKGGEAVTSDPVVMKIRWRDAISGEPETLELRTTIGALLDGDRHNLRKAKSLMAWSDMLTAEAMGVNPCGKELHLYQQRVAELPDDAEINFVNGLVEKRCGVKLTDIKTPKVGPGLKVRVDADQSISEVGLDCGHGEEVSKLSGSDSVASFQGIQGACTIRLQGRFPLRTTVQVPQTGSTIKCTLRSGRLLCE